MPYTDEDTQRTPFDQSIEDLQKEVTQFHIDDREGVLNYIISRIVVGSFLDCDSNYRYKYMSRAHEAFLAAAGEFKRRVLDPYEDMCIYKHGDIPEYEKFEAWMAAQPSRSDMKEARESKWKGPRRESDG